MDIKHELKHPGLWIINNFIIYLISYLMFFINVNYSKMNFYIINFVNSYTFRLYIFMTVNAKSLDECLYLISLDQ